MSRWTERAILRRVAAAAAIHARETIGSRGKQSASGTELRRWLVVLEAWDAEHAKPNSGDGLFEEAGPGAEDCP